MVPHNAVPQGTTLPWGTAWCIMSVCFCLMSHLFLPLLPSQLVIQCLQLAHDLLQHSFCLLVCLFVCFTCVSVCLYVCLLLFHVSPFSPLPSYPAGHWVPAACPWSPSALVLLACLFVCLFVSLVYLSVYMYVCFCFMSYLLLPLLPSQLVIECLQLAHDLPQHSFCLLFCLFVSLVYLSVSYVCLLLFHVSPFSPLPSYPAGHWVPAACPWSPSALLSSRSDVPPVQPSWTLHPGDGLSWELQPIYAKTKQNNNNNPILVFKNVGKVQDKVPLLSHT